MPDWTTERNIMKSYIRSISLYTIHAVHNHVWRHHVHVMSKFWIRFMIVSSRTAPLVTWMPMYLPSSIVRMCPSVTRNDMYRVVFSCDYSIWLLPVFSAYPFPKSMNHCSKNWSSCCGSHMVQSKHGYLHLPRKISLAVIHLGSILVSQSLAKHVNVTVEEEGAFRSTLRDSSSSFTGSDYSITYCFHS